MDEAPGLDLPGAQWVSSIMGAWSEGMARVWRRDSSSSSSRSPSSSVDGSSKGQRQQKQQQQQQQRDRLVSHPLQDSFLPTGSPAASRPVSPWDQQQQQQQQQQLEPLQQPYQQQKQQPQQRQQRRQEQRGLQHEKQQRLLWPWQQHQQGRAQGHSKLPRSSWRHRKEIEEAGQLEVGSVMSRQGLWVCAASFKLFLMSLTGRWPQTVLCIKQQLHAVL